MRRRSALHKPWDLPHRATLARRITLLYQTGDAYAAPVVRGAALEGSRLSKVLFSNGRRMLHAAPIKRDWVMAGSPEATACAVFETADRQANVHEWRCTRGRFVWHYDIDEIVYIIEGSASIKDLATGVTTTISAGSSVLFQRGSGAEWTVDQSIRKIAIIHVPLSPKVLVMRNAWRRLKRLFGKRDAVEDGGLGAMPLDERTV
jgi:uncharacterized protein